MSNGEFSPDATPGSEGGPSYVALLLLRILPPPPLLGAVGLLLRRVAAVRWEGRLQMSSCLEGEAAAANTRVVSSARNDAAAAAATRELVGTFAVRIKVP